MNTVTLACVGDVYARQSTVSAVEADPSLVEAAVEVLSRADVRFANLEAPLLDAGRARFSTGVRLKSPTGAGRLLRRLGVDVVTLANNHLMDFGAPGLASTLRQLSADGIPFTGAGRDADGASRPAVVEVRGQRLAFLGACDDQGGGATTHSPGVCLLEPGRLVPAVRRLRRRVDHVIVGVHTGIEFVPSPEPFFLSLARRLIDAGASVVAGHHPHVPQGVVRHGRGVIACSLGDFLFDLPRDDNDMSSRQRQFNRLHAVLEVELSSQGAGEHRMHWLARDATGRYASAPATDGFDPERELAAMSRVAADGGRLAAAADAVYREELYQALYTVYTALYLAVRRGRPAMLRGLPWWLGTYRREPKRRFVREGLRAAGRWAFARLRGGARP